MPDVSVITVTWNSASCIEACLESIRTHGGEDILEVIVVDNGSADDTCGRVTSAYPETLLLRTGANLGFPKANNLAAQHARGKYLLFLNPDARMDNNAVAHLRAHLLSNPTAGIAGPQISSEDGQSIAVDARAFPSLRGTAFRYFGLRSLFPTHPIFGGEHLPPAQRDRPRSIECLTGAAMFMKKELFLSLGGFDEQLPMYFEDMDLCGKVNRAGHRCYFVPEAQVTHIGGKSTARSPIARFLFSLENGQAPWMYFRKYRNPRALWQFTFLLALGNIFRLTLYLLAAPLSILPRIRTALIVRSGESLTLLRWCASNKNANIAKAQAQFDEKPLIDLSPCISEEQRHDT